MSGVKILVAQGGGPTAVINQSLVGVVLEARTLPASRARLRRAPRRARHRQRGPRRPDPGDQPQPRAGGRHAVLGAGLDPRQARPAPTASEIFKVLQAHGIGYFFYIGGNDSSDTVRIVSEEAREGRLRRCAASTSPRRSTTTWWSTTTRPGFPSAARFVAQAFAGANLDNRALPGVYVGVVMGRHAGFLTAASALGAEVRRRRPAPDLPARARLRARALPGRREGRARTRHGRCVVAVSEGIHDASGAADRRRSSPRRSSATRTATCSSRAPARWPTCCATQIKAKLGIKRVRGDTFGYLQRSLRRLRLRRRPARGARGRREGGAVRDVGRRATARSPSSAPASTPVDYELTPLDEVAGKTRVMDDEFIDARRHRRDRRLPHVPAAAARLRACRRRTGCARRRWPRC